MARQLRRLVRRAQIGELLADTAAAFGGAVALFDRDGSWVAGVGPPPSGARVPIVIGDEVKGSVAAAANPEALAAMVELTLRHEHERRALSEETLERYKEINFLYTFAERLGGCFGRNETAALVREEAGRLFDADVAAVLLADEEAGGLALASTSAERPPELTRLLLQRQLIDRVLRSGRSELVEEREGEASGLGSVMCAPLRSSQRTIGVVALATRRVSAWRSSDVKLLSSLASQAASAIENALLHERKVQEEILKSRLARYVSPQLVDALLREGEEVGSMASERRRIAVLFSDIRDFTTTAENLAPEALVGYLNEYFTEMVEVIFTHEGTVNKFVGDMIMALFGAPAPLPHNERQALETAISMQERLMKIPNQWIREHFHMGIGINAGDVVVGNIGSPQHMDYTAIGDDVNVASRLQAIARPGEILVSRSVVDAVGDEFRFRDFGKIRVKGKQRPVEVFEVVF